MRLLLEFESDVPQLIKFNYNYKLASALIQKIVSTHYGDLMAKIHTQYKYKPYTFSLLKFPKNRFKHFENGKLAGFLVNKFKLFFSSLYDEIIFGLIEALLADGRVRIGSATFYLRNYKIMNDKKFKPNKNYKFKTLSPITVRLPFFDGNGKLKYRFLKPTEEMFWKKINLNLVRKFYYFKNLNENIVNTYSFDNCPEVIKLISVEKVKFMKIFVKCSSVEAYDMVFTIKGTPEFLELAYKVGFGELNGMGFGMVECLEDE